MNLILISGISDTKLAIIVLAVIAVLAALLCIYLLIKVFLLSERVRTLEEVRKNSTQDPHYLASTFVRSKQVCNYINEQVDKGMEKFMRKPSTLAIITEAVDNRIRLQNRVPQSVTIEKRPNLPINVPIEQDVKPLSNPNYQEPQTPIRVDDSNRVYYASALEEDNKTFYAVVDQPIEGETIFKFRELKKGKCEYIIYERAYSKVLADDNFLTGACNLSKLGNSRVIVEKNGIAELNSDNKWVVTTPAVVRFE